MLQFSGFARRVRLVISRNAIFGASAALVIFAAFPAATATIGTLGNAPCQTCHRAQAIPHAHTAMGNALETVKECEILKSHPRLTFQKDKYRYLITRDGDQSIYEVTDGTQTVRVPIEWAFGLGSAGQTYVFQRDGVYYESRVSFFKAVQGLDLTMGAAAMEPHDIDQAAGRVMAAREAFDCFNCHSTNAGKQREVDVATLRPGIQCERCHGSATAHLAAVKSGDVQHVSMKKLGAMTTEETSDFCGQCHRTWSQIATNGPQGVNNVRFQPYRLTNSKCYSVDDPRIRCTACHDPHNDVVTTPESYDTKCFACHADTAHSVAKATAPKCPVATKNCVTCHMPKIELPGSHNLFTDHQIRIAKKNGPYPN